MKRIKKMLMGIGTSLGHAVRRFPVAVVLAALAMCLFLFLNHSAWDASALWPQRAAAASVLGTVLAALAALVAERSRRPYAQLVCALCAVAASVIYAVTLPENPTERTFVTYAVLVLIALIACVLAQHFPSRNNVQGYAAYVLGRFLLTLGFAFVIFMAAVMILATLDQLFELPISYLHYVDAFYVVAALFAVPFFLGSIPPPHTVQSVSDAAYAPAGRTLLAFIAWPLMWLYLAILCAYFLKILVEGALPNGVIGNLVPAFALISVGVLFFSAHPPLRAQFAWLERMERVYVAVMAIPVGMLIWALSLRVGAFGMTPVRYYVMALTAFTVLALISVFLKPRRRGVLMGVLAATVLAVSTFGVFSAYAVSERSQTRRLEGMLTEAGMLSERGIELPSAPMRTDEKAALRHQIAYMRRTFGGVAYLEAKGSVSEEALLAFLGDLSGADSVTRSIRYTYMRVPQEPISLDAHRGFDALLQVESWRFERASVEGYEVILSGEGKTTVTVEKDGRQWLSMDLSRIAAERLKTGAVQYNRGIALDAPIEIEGEGVHVTLIFEHAEGRTDSEGTLDTFELSSFEAWLLIDIP